MKIILIHDIPALGNTNQVLDVASGYARNFLLPKGFAVPWSLIAAEEIKKKEALAVKTMAEIEQNAESYAEKLNNITVKFTAKTSDKDTLFGSITEDDIIKKITEEEKIAIGKKNLLLTEHIKKTGKYTIPVKLSDKVTAEIKVVVSKEKASSKK